MGCLEFNNSSYGLLYIHTYIHTYIYIYIYIYFLKCFCIYILFKMFLWHRILFFIFKKRNKKSGLWHGVGTRVNQLIWEQVYEVKHVIENGFCFMMDGKLSSYHMISQVNYSIDTTMSTSCLSDHQVHQQEDKPGRLPSTGCIK